ncbi:MAG: hypothetical protein QOF16_1297 [Actinomycetota bacterium]|nr:hypothetical protein [Actinomycetota bacterium]
MAAALFDASDPRLGRVTVRRSAVVIGSLVALAYVATALIAGHREPNVARPLLDGLTAPPAYRWVDPPPDLASGNKQPVGGTSTIAVAKKKTAAGAFSTPDAQLSIVLEPAALKIPPDTTSVQIALTPLAPAAVQANPPSGLEVAGNIERIQAIAQPSGNELTTFDPPARVVLVYPASSTGTHVSHTLLFSPSGQTWTRIKTSDSTVQQQASGLLPGAGYVAVAAPPASGSSSTRWITIAIVVAAVLLLATLLIADIRRVRRLRAES